MRRDVFQGIADPQRRAIINLVAAKPMNLNSISEKFDISRPAISKHIKILAECRLISIRQEGRERICEARLSELHEVSDWLEKYRHFWTNKMAALDNYLMDTPPKSKRKSTTKSKRK